MTAQIRAFLHANPVHMNSSPAQKRGKIQCTQLSARWDKLKVHIQDAARGYCFTFQRTGQLRVLRMRASQARAAYVASPGSRQALDELRHTAAALQQQATTDALRAGV